MTHDWGPYVQSAIDRVLLLRLCSGHGLAGTRGAGAGTMCWLPVQGTISEIRYLGQYRGTSLTADSRDHTSCSHQHEAGMVFI